MAIIIDNKLRVGGDESHHKKLVKRLDEQKTLSKTAFISLNYDILIDNALTDCYQSYDLDYGVEFTNSDDSWKKPRPEKSISLYKLHGSLNWLYCPTCISLKLTPKEKSVPKLVFKSEECKCGSEMIPIIIPPTFFKVMSNFYLQQIWYKSEIALRQAKKIIFCGYSFSDADIHVKYLLKRAEINNGNTPEIYIINSHSNKTGKEKKDEKEKYKRFFNVKEKVHYIDQSFQDFCDQDVDLNKEIKHENSTKSC